MWLLTTIAENLANALALYLAMFNSGAHESMREFTDGMPKPDSTIKMPWSKS